MDNKIICITCGNGFLSKYLLNEHSRKYHTFKECDGCGKSIAASHFKRHTSTHVKKKEDTFNCDTWGGHPEWNKTF